VQAEAHTMAVLAHPNNVPVVGIVKTAKVLDYSHHRLAPGPVAPS